jgi:hypothetical protein
MLDNLLAHDDHRLCHDVLQPGPYNHQRVNKRPRVTPSPLGRPAA